MSRPQWAVDMAADINSRGEQLDRERAALAAVEALYDTPTPKSRAKAAPAVKATRKSAIAPGSLANRISDTLTAFGAPMKKSAVIEEVKAPADAVTADLKRLRAASRIVLNGKSRSARWSIPKFAHVIVADDADE